MTILKVDGKYFFDPWIDCISTFLLESSSYPPHLLSSEGILRVAGRNMQGTKRLKNLNCMVPWQKFRIIFLGLRNFVINKTLKQNLFVGKKILFVILILTEISNMT